MHVLARLAPLALLGLAAVSAAAAAPAFARSAQADELRALDGKWLYVEDRTEGRPEEQQQPSMSTTFELKVEDGAVTLVRGKGDDRRELRMPLDGSPADQLNKDSVTRYRGRWEGGAFAYDTEIVRKADDARIASFHTEMRPTAEGLLVRVLIEGPAPMDSIALYRHPDDIPLPEPAAAAIGDLAWLAGAWVGARGSASIEERWSPPLGGAMLGTSRTVARGSMVGFEYLRVVERDGGLVYVAQPGGAPPTEFVLTERGEARAVFQNPRHDFPQRIVYELASDGRLTASIGFAKGGKPQTFEFRREGS